MFIRGGAPSLTRTRTYMYFKRALPGTCNCKLAQGILGVHPPPPCSYAPAEYEGINTSFIGASVNEPLPCWQSCTYVRPSVHGGQPDCACAKSGYRICQCLLKRAILIFSASCREMPRERLCKRQDSASGSLFQLSRREATGWLRQR